jgi:hypothetical protein
VVYGAALEKQSPIVSERGFESHPLRQKKKISFTIYIIRTGEVLEWTIRHAWRACVAFGYRGFESHPLRQPTPRLRLASQMQHVVRLCPEEFER